MYNNVFREYINKMIGENPFREAGFEYSSMISNFNRQTTMDLECLYPDLYKLLYPMIKTVCKRNTEPIKGENIDTIVNEVYSNFHHDEVSELQAKNKKIETYKIAKNNNIILKDLIKILVIEEILGSTRNKLEVF